MILGAYLFATYALVEIAVAICAKHKGNTEYADNEMIHSLQDMFLSMTLLIGGMYV